MIGVQGIAAPVLTERAPLKRFPDWELRLKRWINANQSTKFEWARWDCCMAMCDGVAVQTGVDPGQRVRGQFGGRATSAENALDAAKCVMRLTGVPVYVDAVSAELVYWGLRPAESPKLARRGDVVMIELPDGPTWGLVDLTGRRIVMASKVGLAWASIAAGARAWYVGE